MSWSKYQHVLSYVFWWLAESAAYVSAFLSKSVGTGRSGRSRRSSSSASGSIYCQILSLTLIWRSQYHFSQFLKFVSMILMLLPSFEAVIMNRLKNNEEWVKENRWVDNKSVKMWLYAISWCAQWYFDESRQAGLITLAKFIQKCNSVIFNLKQTVFQR